MSASHLRAWRAASANARGESVSAESLAHRALSQRRYIYDWCSKWGQVPADEKEKLHQTMVDADGFERMIQLAADHGGNIPSWLDELTQPFWYHHDKGIVYPLSIGLILPLLWLLIHLWWRRTRAGRCTVCSYNLTATLSGVCPECGSPIVDQPVGS